MMKYITVSCEWQGAIITIVNKKHHLLGGVSYIGIVEGVLNIILWQYYIILIILCRPRGVSVLTAEQTTAIYL
jgi:hypothetical protein